MQRAPSTGPGIERSAWVWPCGKDGCWLGEVTSPGKYCLSWDNRVLGVGDLGTLPDPQANLTALGKFGGSGTI